VTAVQRVAIVGSGIAGLAAARALAGRPGVAVEVFEASPRPGGHIHTVTVDGARGPVAVDLGFIVFNRENYPHFSRLLAELRIETRPTSMAFSVALPARDLEWSSASLSAMFADRRRVVDPRHWRFLVAVLRFLRDGRRDLGGTLARRASIEEYVAARRVPGDVTDGFIIPLAAALWSLAPARCIEFPAETFLRFLDQHGMLRPVRPLAWRTIVGGSQRYVDALITALPAPIHLGRPVTRVHRDSTGVTLLAGGHERRFDRVVLACHADVALALIDEPTAGEARVLGAFRYSHNHVVLHNDITHLPRRPAARAAWNYVADPDLTRASVTYWMNRLQGLAEPAPYLVTLNPRAPIAAGLYEATMDHPQLDLTALAAQAELPALQGTRRTYHAGAHHGFGFHEDGLRAGLAAAARILADAAGPRTATHRERVDVDAAGAPV
jgi:predicted NAD/FAD-binding protein